MEGVRRRWGRFKTYRKMRRLLRDVAKGKVLTVVGGICEKCGTDHEGFEDGTLGHVK